MPNYHFCSRQQVCLTMSPKFTAPRHIIYWADPSDQSYSGDELFNHFVFNGYGTGLVEIARFNLFKHSQNFNSAHINFKLEAVLSHPLVKGLGYKVYGGVCIDNSNPSILLFDKFKLEASTPHITQFGSSDLVSVLSSATWINLDLDTSNVAHGSYDEGEEGSPNCVLIITANIPNTSGATLNNILVRGMITLL